MEGHIASAEKQAQAFVLAQLRKVKAEADQALQEIDKVHAQTMKMVDDAVEATHRRLEDTAQGKMLEIEVHVATMYKDLGDDTRFKAVKQQLHWYVENKQPIPEGYGEAAPPPPKPGEQPATEKKDGEEKKDDKKDGEKKDGEKKDGDKKDEAKADNKDEKLSEEEIDKEVAALIKRGQRDTSVAAAEAAHERVGKAHEAATKAVEDTAKKKAAELEALERGDPEARKDVDQYYADKKAGEQAADDIKKAMTKKGRIYGTNPDKAAVMKALEGKTKPQIEAMRAELEAQGIDLDDFIEKELSDDDKQEAKIRLQGNPQEADIAALTIHGGAKLTGNQKLATAALLPGGNLIASAADQRAFGGDPERIKEILARYKGEDLKKFEEQFAAKTGQPLSEFLAQNGMADEAKAMGIEPIKEDDRAPEVIKEEAKHQAYVLSQVKDKDGRPVDTAAAAKSVNDLGDALKGLHLDSTRGDMVRAALEGKSPEEMAYIRAQYRAQTGRELDRDLEKGLSGPALVEAKAHLRGDKTEVALNKILGAEDASLTPWTVDDKKLQDALKELKDPADRKAVLDAYKARTGVDLSEVIAEKMTGNDEKLARALYEGDELKARAIELDEATNGGFMNSMHQAIEERTGLPTQQFTRGLAKLAIPSAGGDTTFTLGGYEIGNGSIHKVDSDKIFELLEQTPSPADRARLAALYKQQTGRDLRDDMAHKLVGATEDQSKDQHKLQAFEALMDGRTDDYYAARMDDALSGLNDTKAFHKQLEGKSAWERQAIINAYNKRHGDNPNAFVELCENQLDGLDREKAHLLATLPDDVKTGAVKLPDEFVLRYAQDSVWNKTAKFIDENTTIFDKYPILYSLPVVGYATMQAKTASYFMRGWGVDNDAIKGVLAGKSKAEIEELKKQYPNLEADLKYCLSGRDAFEVELMLAEGEPKTPEEKAKRALAMYEFDRGSRGAWIPGFEKVSNAIVDLVSPSGKMMDAQAAELRAQLAVLQAGGNLSPQQQYELDLALGMMSASTSTYLTAREAVTGAIATAVGAVVGAVVTVLTGGAAAPFLAALATGLSTVAVKVAMLGQSYGRNDIGVDLAMMAVSVATAGIGAGAQTFLAQVVSGGISNAISSFVSTAITSKDAHDLLGLLAQASKSGLVGFMSGAAGAAAQKALDDAMQSLGKKLFKADVFGEGASLGATFVKGFVTGGGSSVASMLVEAAADPSILEGHWDAVFANVMKTFAEGGLQNALSETAEAHGQRREAAKATLAEATEAAKRVQAAGGSVEDQQRAFADVMAKGAQQEAARTPPAEEPPRDVDAVQQRLDDHPPITPDKIVDVGGEPDAGRRTRSSMSARPRPKRSSTPAIQRRPPSRLRAPTTTARSARRCRSATRPRPARPTLRTSLRRSATSGASVASASSPRRPSTAS